METFWVGGAADEVEEVWMPEVEVVVLEAMGITTTMMLRKHVYDKIG